MNGKNKSPSQRDRFCEPAKKYEHRSPPVGKIRRFNPSKAATNKKQNTGASAPARRARPPRTIRERTAANWTANWTERRD
jgi:hypothetical protein